MAERSEMPCASCMVPGTQLTQAALCEADRGVRDTQLPKVYMVVVINDELDLAEILLHEVFPVVDKVVVSEATVTNGKHPQRKPTHFRDNLSRFSAYSEVVESYVVPDHWMPLDPVQDTDTRYEPTNAVRRINAQRLYAITSSRTLSDAHPTSIILIADIDEIPKREFLGQLKYCNQPHFPIQAQLRFHWFSLAFEWRGIVDDSPGPVGKPWINLLAATLGVVRFTLQPNSPCGAFRYFYDPGVPCHSYSVRWMEGIVESHDVGWHLSYFGGAQRFVAKINSFAATKWARPEFEVEDQIAQLQRVLRVGSDPWGRFNKSHCEVGLWTSPECSRVERLMRSANDRTSRGFVQHTDPRTALGLMGVTSELPDLIVPPRWGVAFPRLVTEFPMRFRYMLPVGSWEVLNQLDTVVAPDAIAVSPHVDDACDLHLSIRVQNPPVLTTGATLFVFLNGTPLLRVFPAEGQERHNVRIGKADVVVGPSVPFVVTAGIVDEGSADLSVLSSTGNISPRLDCAPSCIDACSSSRPESESEESLAKTEL
mmetsp:Transcript_49730/g.116903  ORF Transcript_49730/g.116903 Transcript_49730/m.116903 type:complete len:539 (+) Transcript_49730:671-2287(+)